VTRHCPVLSCVSVTSASTVASSHHMPHNNSACALGCVPGGHIRAMAGSISHDLMTTLVSLIMLDSEAQRTLPNPKACIAIEPCQYQ
jgi:hypothetical protein